MHLAIWPVCAVGRSASERWYVKEGKVPDALTVERATRQVTVVAHCEGGVLAAFGIEEHVDARLCGQVYNPVWWQLRVGKLDGLKRLRHIGAGCKG
eukprot:5499587-Amphidinium_carterae.1